MHSINELTSLIQGYRDKLKSLKIGSPKYLYTQKMIINLDKTIVNFKRGIIDLIS